jgi:GT2 family glycosyltransferase
MERIIAVVVSYNRHALLAECINAIRYQTKKPDAILVVNNGSVDYTSVWLDQQTDIIQIYQENKGSAGGYNTAISWAYEKGYSMIWCMDDDSCPKYDALENLLLYKGYELELLNCAVINKDNKSTFVSKTKNYSCIEEVKERMIEGVCHPFNGTLIHRSIIEKVGLPQTNFFYWGEEREYFYRIVNKYKIPAKTITHSIVYHPELSHAHKKEWDYQSSWKMYFYIRNRYKVLQSKYRFKIQAFFHYCYFLLAFVKSIVKYQKQHKFRKMIFMLWPIKDAIKNYFEHTPETVINKMATEYNKPITKIVFAPVKKAILSFFVPPYSDGSKAALMDL